MAVYFRKLRRVIPALDSMLSSHASLSMPAQPVMHVQKPSRSVPSLCNKRKGPAPCGPVCLAPEDAPWIELQWSVPEGRAAFLALLLRSCCAALDRRLGFPNDLRGDAEMVVTNQPLYQLSYAGLLSDNVRFHENGPLHHCGPRYQSASRAPSPPTFCH